MALQKVIAEHHRLSILLALGAVPGLKTNDSMLSCSCAEFGHTISQDAMRNHLSWLNEQGLITLETKGPYYLAELTGRGQDVAEGISTCPGVKKPRAK